MCGWWYPRFKNLKELLNKHIFHIFYVDLRLNLVICMNMWWTTKNMWRTFKHIQGNYHAFILNSHHGNINKQLGKRIIPSCKIHMVEEGTLDGSPKGGRKEELGEGEWVSLNTLSFRKTKIWQDYSTSLQLKRREEKRGGFFCVLEWRRWGVYIVVVEEIWMEGHLMRVDKELWT